MIEREIREWWQHRPQSERESLRASATDDRMDESTVRLLIQTRCPVGPVGVKWESEPDFDWQWPSTVREFILKH